MNSCCDALDLDVRDRGALEARQQDAAQAVADRRAEAALERLGEELAVGVGVAVFSSHDTRLEAQIHASELA